MCGRLAVTLPHGSMATRFDAQPANDLPPERRFNTCPTDPVAVITGGPEGRRYRPMRWGFLPGWYKALNDGPLLINARSESIAEKPAFREACRLRRCLIPATGFYEWNKDAEGNRQPWFVRPADGAPLVLAGVWQDWEQAGERIASFAIVTCPAGVGLAHIHHREPVSLAPEDWGKWLGEEGKGAARLMRAAPRGRLTSWRVGRAVNSNRASGAGLIEPLESDEP